MSLPRRIEGFLEDMGHDQLFAPLVDSFREAFEEVRDLGDDDANMISLFDAFAWILGHRDRPIIERIEMCTALRDEARKGPARINLRKFTGWK